MMSAIASALLATLLLSAPVAAADATLTIEPPTVAVAEGSEFVVQVAQDAPVAISGAQASIDFDPATLQVVSVERGPAYAQAPIFLPQDMDATIRTANATGRLAQVAAALIPPSAVPAGGASFLVVRFRVVGCGETDLTLATDGGTNAQMISGVADVYGQEVPVATRGGHVTTCVDPGAVTAGITDVAPSTTGGGSPPLGPIAAAGVIAAGLIGLLAVRSRLRRQPDHEVA
jgi:hypothetical protein